MKSVQQQLLPLVHGKIEESNEAIRVSLLWKTSKEMEYRM
jgi:hypothetical protein